MSRHSVFVVTIVAFSATFAIAYLLMSGSSGRSDAAYAQQITPTTTPLSPPGTATGTPVASGYLPVLFRPLGTPAATADPQVTLTRGPTTTPLSPPGTPDPGGTTPPGTAAATRDPSVTTTPISPPS